MIISVNKLHFHTINDYSIQKITMLKFLYKAYQLIFCAPFIILSLIILTGFTVIGTHLGNPHFWAYHPGRIWSKVIIRVLFLPVKVEGRENIKKNESYVFVANHQGSFDIFLIYGFLQKNFKWMMKWQLLNIPFVGATCRASKHIIVDKRSPSKIKKTYEDAHKTLSNGMSIVLFPEGARTFTGHMGFFRRGAFMLADELQLPVVPLTINGSFNVMPRQEDMHFAHWHPLTLTIHPPIYPETKGIDNQKRLSEESYNAIQAALADEYKGFVENPDQ